MFGSFELKFGTIELKFKTFEHRIKGQASGSPY